MLEIHPPRKVVKQSVSVPVASPSRHRRWPEPRPDLDRNEDPTRRLLVARERANLVGLKLFGSEASDPCVVESTTHLGCLLEPAGDGVPGKPFGPGNRGNADTLDSESDDPIESSSSMLETVVGRCASSKLLRPRNQGLTLRLNSGPKTAKLRRYAQRCCLPRLTWRPCHSGDVSAPRRPGVGERRFAAASDGAEERAPTPTARRHGTGFLGCPSRFVARVGEPPAHRPRGHRSPLASRPIPTVLGKDLAAPPSWSASD